MLSSCAQALLPTPFVGPLLSSKKLMVPFQSQLTHSQLKKYRQLPLLFVVIMRGRASGKGGYVRARTLTRTRTRRGHGHGYGHGHGHGHGHGRGRGLVCACAVREHARVTSMLT